MNDRLEEGTYVHYKNGDQYTVIDMVRHSETGDCPVLYRAEYGDCGLWVRPSESFIELVNLDGQSVPRLKYWG